MALSALLPWGLALGALAILPIVAHLSKQVPRDRRAFGAMLLAERLTQRLRRRRRFKDPLLLLFRVLLMLALALAAAGLEYRYQGEIPTYGGSSRVVVVVDSSLSMSLTDAGASLLSRARSGAEQALDELPLGAQVGLVTYGNEARRLTPELTDDIASVRARVGGIESQGGASNLSAALHEARELLAGEPGTVLLFSDEAGPDHVRGAQAELALLVEGGGVVIPRPVLADPPRNVAVTGAEYGEGIEGGQVSVQVANYGPEPVEVACEVVLPDGAAVPIFVEVAAGSEATERTTVPREALGGVGRVSCEDPDLPFDNAAYFHLPRVGASRVLVVDGDPGDTPVASEVYFLERALAPWGGSRTGVRPDVVSPAGLTSLDPEVHRVVFLANVSDPRPFAAELMRFVREGGNLVITGGSNITAERYEAALAPILPAPIRGPRALATTGEPGVPLELPDLRHDLFAPFSRTGRSLFSNIRTHRVLTVDAYRESDDVQTLLRWEGGNPALIEREVGNGRVLLWTGSVDLSWGNFPLQAAFMPLMQRIVAYLGGESGGTAARFDGFVGETVRVPLPDTAEQPDVLGPTGERIRSRIEAGSVVFTPSVSGAYALSVADAPPLAWVAVNVPASESDVRVYDTVAATEAELEPELFTQRIDLSPWFLGLGFLFLGLQTLLSLRRSSP